MPEVVISSPTAPSMPSSGVGVSNPASEPVVGAVLVVESVLVAASVSVEGIGAAASGAGRPKVGLSPEHAVVNGCATASTAASEPDKLPMRSMSTPTLKAIVVVGTPAGQGSLEL